MRTFLFVKKYESEHIKIFSQIKNSFTVDIENLINIAIKFKKNFKVIKKLNKFNSVIFVNFYCSLFQTKINSLFSQFWSHFRHEKFCY